MSRFATVAKYRDLPLAELAKAKLESEGVYCHLLNKHHIGLNWLYSQALGDVHVQVASEDEQRAQQILANDESYLLGNEALEFPATEASDLCVSCGSERLELIKYSRLSCILIIITQLPLIFWGTRYRCKDCGKIMKVKKS
ncbi:MAG: hypothetical protein CSA20_09530 [Deltaproteobacteria bacterium]|nr:MAG: hypothetical protein CSB28_00550 [Desulfobacterales bacterium]PIE72093.1 MAG: hypothetical protein CSA20_09530 [Deltaproteobacteria bacterium]